MNSTFLPKVAGLVADMRLLGADLLDWRNDASALHVYSRADLKTEGDRRAHRQLSAALTRDFPEIPVISEEDASHQTDRPERYWLIDPIDGTASWLGGFDGFVTQAALIEGEEPVVGLVYAPALDLFYTAAKGEGAWLNGNAMPKLETRDSMILIDNTPQPHGLCEDLMKVMHVTGYIESGSLGLKSCRVADGTADLFVKNVVVRDWDLAPAVVIMVELGAQLTKIDGTPFRFRGSWEKPEGFIAARDTRGVDACLQALSLLPTTEEKQL